MARPGSSIIMSFWPSFRLTLTAYPAGTDFTGTVALGNGTDGVLISGAPSNTEVREGSYVPPLFCKDRLSPHLPLSY